MTYLMTFVESNSSLLLIVSLIISFISILVLICFAVSMRRQKKRYLGLTRGVEGISFEDMIHKINGDISSLNRDINLIERNILSLETKLTFTLQKIGFVRYNAFEDIGSDLSFSIALLDAYNNGFVITSIYGRERSTNFAKQVKNGKSAIPVSPEEFKAIDRAIRGEKALDTGERGGDNVQISLFG